MDIITRTEASEKELTRFFTGKPCKHGHVSERHTKSGTCIECGNARSASWNKQTGYGKEYRAVNREQMAEANREWRRRNPEKVQQYTTTESSRITSQLNQAKRRAKAHGWEFNLTKRDITIPDTCPVLGIPLLRTDTRLGDSSPTIDRIDSTKGYTLDNIRVISWRANRLKSDATTEEMRMILNYMESANECNQQH